MRTPTRAARFEREARVTARLQHPGIVPIYEIGRWPDGTPFYAMRMVDGRTLFDALAAADGLAARLALLPAVIAATEAVAFAHAHRVIHRDLTPANVIVGAYGETVVIDWGLAKDLAEPADPSPPVGPTGPAVPALVERRRRRRPPRSPRPPTPTPTRAGPRTSPAPARSSAPRRTSRPSRPAAPPSTSAPTSTRSARSSTTCSPAARRTPAAPTRSSAGSSPIRRRRSKRPPRRPRDLISIVGKAMARDPARRYASARELADELVRFRAGLLVEAHAYSRRELWWRWARRHSAAVIAAAAALVAIAVASAISVSRVVEERDRAERERAGAIRASARLLEEQGRQEAARR